MLTSIATIAAARADYALTTTIAVPPSPDNNVGGQFKTFDISYFDSLTQLDYVADRSNAAVDVFSAITNSYVGRIGGSAQLFSGQTASNDTSGPDGVQVINLPGQHQVYAGIASRNMRQVSNRPEVGIQFELLAERNVDAGETAAHGRGYRTLQGHPSPLDRCD